MTDEKFKNESDSEQLPAHDISRKETERIFGESRLVNAGEYNNLLDRFQSIWVKLKNESMGCEIYTKEDAPCFYIHERPYNMANAYYAAEGNFYGVTSALLSGLKNPREVDAFLYHEVGHDILGHTSLSEAYDEQYFEKSQKQEFAADSVAIAHCHGPYLTEGIRKFEGHSSKEKSWRARVPLIGDWWEQEYVKSLDQGKTHPSFDRRADQEARLTRELCSDAAMLQIQEADELTKEPSAFSDFNNPGFVSDYIEFEPCNTIPDLGSQTNPCEIDSATFADIIKESIIRFPIVLSESDCIPTTPPSSIQQKSTCKNQLKH